MPTPEFLLQLQALRNKYDMQFLTGTEYNRQLLKLHADHAAQCLVNQQGTSPADEPITATEVYRGQQAQRARTPVLSRGLTYAHTEWASQHDWYRSRGLDSEGYYVLVRDDAEGIAGVRTFRDYNELRAWAGY